MREETSERDDTSESEAWDAELERDEFVALEQAIERAELVALGDAVEPAGVVGRMEVGETTGSIVLGELTEAPGFDRPFAGAVGEPIEIDESVQLIAFEDVFADGEGMAEAEVEQPAGAERRTEPRYSLVEPAVIEVESWTALVALYTKDISCGGMFVQTDAPPERDTQVALQLLLPDGAGTLEFEGNVVHVVTAAQAEAAGTTAGFGLQFSDLTAERRRALQRLIDQAKAAAARPSADGPSLHELGSTCAPGDQGTPLRLTLSEAERQQLQELRAELAAMMARGDLEVLGLQGAGDLDELRDAFERAGRRWHPGQAYRDAPPEIRRLATEIFLRIEQAYRKLRAASHAAASTPPAAAASRPAPHPPAAEPPRAAASDPAGAQTPSPARGAQRAMADLAERSSLLAAQLKRREPKVAAPPDEQRVLVDEALRLVADKRYREAAERLELVLERKPDPRLRVLLCVVQARQALTERDFARARERYEAVLQLDPSNEVAQRELLMLSALQR